MRTLKSTLLAGLLLTFLVAVRNDATVTNSVVEWEEVQVEATAYCPCSHCCGQWADGITATGEDAFAKGVAVDRSMIPLGSTVVIPGYGTVIADDVGGAIKERRIDVRFPSHQAALEWGRQKITILYRIP